MLVCLFVYLIYSSRGLVTSGGTWARDGLFDINSQVSFLILLKFKGIVTKESKFMVVMSESKRNPIS